MAHRYRLYPTKNQLPVLAMHREHARVVWNMALEQTNLHGGVFGKAPNHTARNKQLAEARRSIGWLGAGSSSVQQQALRDFDQAMRNWWGGSHGRPTWRKYGVNESFRVRDVRVRPLNRRWAELAVPKVGYVKFRLSRPLPPEYGTATISLDRSGRWHVSFTAPQPAVERVETGREVGIDMGVEQSVTTSDAEHVNLPALLSPGESRRKLHLQRKLARQVKGSNRRERTRLRLARISARETDRRKDWIEKVTTDLVRRYDFIAIEDLKVANMVASAAGTIKEPGKRVAQKRGLNRSISNQAWATFRTRLEQKAAAATSPCEVVAVPARNTSRRCSGCGFTSAENRKSQAIFACQSCGFTDNADVNAAKNVLAAGLVVSGRGTARGILEPRGLSLSTREACGEAFTEPRVAVLV